MNRRDRTYSAASRQLAAMRAPRYEVGVKEPAKDGKMQLRRWTADQILDSIAWLKYQNFQVNHVYVRPEGNQGLVMMDDATQATVKQLHADGLTPACVIESSPLNFQVWLRVSEEALPNETATTLAQYLADRYDTDKAAADWRRFGRLAGFTNVKPSHVDKNGRYPFALLTEHRGASVADPDRLLDAAETWARARDEHRKLTFDPIPTNQDAETFFQNELRRLMARYGETNFEASVGDWMIGGRMMQAGFSDADIAAAMAAHSPDIDARKRGRVDQYIAITLASLRKRFAG